MTPLRCQSTLLALLVAWATPAACAGRRQPAAAAPQPGAVPTPTGEPSETPPADSTAWLAVDSAARTARLTLEVTRPAGAPSALINGYRAGEAQIVVPVAWTITWTWRNTDSTASHSLAVMVQREKIPLEGGRVAFSNALTRMVTVGLPVGETDNTTFEAEEAGWYWLLCGVPNHALAGEWLELRVDPTAKTAMIKIKGVNSKR
jgi:hypothetical protein